MSKILAERLTALRKSYGFSRQAMADKLQMSVNTYQKYEFDQAEPKLETLLRISKLMKVSTDYLLGREELPNPLAGLKITVNDKPFIETYQQFPDYVKQILIEAMQKLAEAAQRDDATEGELDTEIACTPLPWAIPPVEESKAIASADVDTHSLEEPPADESMFENVPKKDV